MVQSYYDNAGLYRKYGTDKATATKAGEYHMFGPLKLIEVTIDLTTLTSVAGATILADTTFFPKMRIEEIILDVTTAVTGTNATLDIGLVGTDRSTEIDFNGFIAAETKANMDTAGKKITYSYGSTNYGALIGTTTASVGHLVANYNTAAFTAGVVVVRIYYRAL